MKRLLALGAVVALVTACGADAVVRTQAHASVKSIAAAREQIALGKAGRLLRQIPLPPGAVRVAHAPANQYLHDRWVGGSVITMFAGRHSFWRVPGSLASVVRFAKAHPAPGLVWNGGGFQPGQWSHVAFYGRFQRPLQRMASVVAVDVHGTTYVRVDAAVAWIYPRSPREALPAGLREIDINGGGVTRHVTNAADVRRIVRWFGQLNVTPPGMGAVGCMLNISTKVKFAFRSADRAVVARAVVPSGGATGCNPITFTLGGKAQTPLVDTTAVPFAERVERLLGVCFGAGPHGGHQVSPRCNKTWAVHIATHLLDQFVPPTGAQALSREPSGDGGLLRSPATSPGTAELVDQHRFWRVHLPLADAVAFVEHEHHARQAASSTTGGPGIPPNRSVSFTYIPRNGLIASRTVEVTFVTLPHGWTGLRVDAQVIWIYPRALLAPPATNRSVIEVRAGSTKRRITNDRLVERITFRFDRLQVVQPGTVFHCPAMRPGGGPTVTIDFHGFHPTASARAIAPGTRFLGPCNPIVFSTHGKTVRLAGGDFVQWLEGVLGERFR